MALPAGFSKSPLLEDPSTRLFIIRSSCGEHVVKSIEHSVWATLRKNEEKLDRAFRGKGAVILVFSVNRSGAFQGFARMRSVTGKAKASTDPFDGFGKLFDVEWLRAIDVQADNVSHLENSLDNGRAVGFSRDGQELTQSVGAELCRHFDLQQFHKNPTTYEPLQNKAFVRGAMGDLLSSITASKSLALLTVPKQRSSGMTECKNSITAQRKGSGRANVNRGKSRGINNDFEHRKPVCHKASPHTIAPIDDIDFRFTGTLVGFDSRVGQGTITVDPGYAFSNGTPVPSEIVVKAEQLNTDGEKPGNFDNLAVEFSIEQNAETWHARRVALPGGLPMTQAILENRQLAFNDGLHFFGVIRFRDHDRGFGFIQLQEPDALPAHIQSRVRQRGLLVKHGCSADPEVQAEFERLLYFRDADADFEAPSGMGVGTEITCQVYTDDYGAGACDVQLVMQSTTDSADCLEKM